MTIELSRRGFISAAGAAVLAGPACVAAMTGAEALALASARRDELVELLGALIRIRSLSGEAAGDAQRVVTDFLERLPYRVEQSADRPSGYVNHPEYMTPNPPGDGPFVNVIGWPGQEAGERFAMFAHIDTHSMEPGWDTAPLEPVLDGNRLYGLGTSDDKGGVATMLVAAALLAEQGEKLPVVMSLHGKGGGSRGSLPVFDRISRTEHGIGAVLYVHPAETGRGLEDIKNAVMGVVDLELAVTGWRAPPMEIGSVDSSAWEEGGNALDLCWEVLGHLRFGVFDGIAFNLGVMEGGDRIGSVADKATARFRLKFTGQHTWSGLLESARQAVDEFAAALPASSSSYLISLDPIGYRTNPGEADWEAPVSIALREAIEDVTGRAPHAYPNHYAGDIRYPIRLLGVPAYGIGSIGGNFYGPNEWVDIDDLVRLVAVLVETISAWNRL